MNNEWKKLYEETMKVVNPHEVSTSCGACREFMMHLGGEPENIEMLLDKEGRTMRLIDMMPEYPVLRICASRFNMRRYY